MAMNLGPTELIIILVIVLIVFGAGRLPQVFSSLGKGVKEFREASEGNDTTEVSKTTTTTTTPVATTPVVTPPIATTPVVTTPTTTTTVSTTTTPDDKIAG
jgi:sec-independent protein translocase protein TatA